ncbi:hypothetical protein CBS101457_003894 [Exobasidium rhododendri]|nr:hypothetical protein CBS101457_003894 [Exobasidium rhododendri]
MTPTPSDPATTQALATILAELNEMKLRNAQLEMKVDQLHGAATIGSPSSHSRRISSNGLSPLTRPHDAIQPGLAIFGSSPPSQPLGPPIFGITRNEPSQAAPLPQTNNPTPLDTPDLGVQAAGNELQSYYSSRVILTTYPGQSGIHPVPLNWYAESPHERGPVIASRHPNSIKIRNAIGAYGGAYSVYRALAVAIGKLNPNHRPDYTNTEPPFDILPNPSWFTPGKIVSLDPWGHLAPQLFRKEFEEGKDIRPTISMTRAHIKMPEIDEAFRLGRIPLDGKIVVKSERLPGVPIDVDPGIEINCSKAAVEPCWFLPGIAQKLGVSEGQLRRALFEDTGGMYPELLTRHDLKVFLPPIAGLTVYIFGPPQHMSDPTKETTVRVHDQCGGSDVFSSDVCTCRPYLVYGVEEAIKTAQRGGSGIVIYFGKEGRALGEVTKYLVYNARKRGTDDAAMYFQRTIDIAGVEDMRFQVIGPPDVLHWLGGSITDSLLVRPSSVSNLKYDAIVGSGIPIHKRYEIPDELIPADSKVEIDAKIFSGYFSGTKNFTAEDLKKTVGRGWQEWEDIPH